MLALDNWADATASVAGRIRRGSAADQAVGDGNALAWFRALTATPEWRDRRRSALGRSSGWR